MARLFSVAVVAVAVVVAPDEPRHQVSEPARDPPKATLPVGRWRVEFANGVKESVSIGNGGESNVEELRRRCVGMAEVKGASVVIAFGDDRIERWTPVGDRYVVEHWFPTSRLPVTAPVVGIADRARD